MYVFDMCFSIFVKELFKTREIAPKFGSYLCRNESNRIFIVNDFLQAFLFHCLPIRIYFVRLFYFV